MLEGLSVQQLAGDSDMADQTPVLDAGKLREARARAEGERAGIEGSSDRKQTDDALRDVNGDRNPREFGDCRAAPPESFAVPFVLAGGAGGAGTGQRRLVETA